MKSKNYDAVKSLKNSPKLKQRNTE